MSSHNDLSLESPDDVLSPAPKEDLVGTDGFEPKKELIAAPISPPVPSPTPEHDEAPKVPESLSSEPVEPFEQVDAMDVEPPTNGSVETNGETNGERHGEVNGETNGETSADKHDRPDDAAEDESAVKRLKTEESSEPAPQQPAVSTPAPVTDSAIKAETPNGADAVVEADRDYSELDPPEPSSQPLPKHQNKFALSVIRSVKRLKDSAPFAHPVDYVKLAIPTYPEIVKNPMDLSTIEKKLVAGEYTSIVSLAQDVDLIVTNCILFNGVDSAISTMSRGMKASFAKHMSNMPAYDNPLGGSAAKPKKKSLPPVVTTPKSQRAAAHAANAAVSASTSLSPTGTPSDSKPFALRPSGIPMIRRDSLVGEGGRPKREIHPPKSKDLPYDAKPRRKKFAAELKFCGQVLKELMSKRYEKFSFPFMQPVDPVALNCPTYFQIIKQPMDLGTVQEKYNNNEYETAEAFASDVKLIFRNCYKFNPAGSPVNDMGRDLEAVFDKKWLEKPIPEPSPPPELSDEFDSSEDEDDIDEGTVTNPMIRMVETHIDTLKKQLAELRREAVRELRLKRADSVPKKRRKSSKGTTEAAGRRKSGPVPRRGSLSGLSAPVTVTYEMKKELSEKITTLTEKKMRHVISIVQEGMPQLKATGEEIELDMDMVDPNTLMRLYNFVVKRDDKAKVKGIRGAGTSSGRRKKSKPLTEAEQSRQIEELQKKMRQFDRARDGAPVEEGSEESSSGEEDHDGSSDDSSSEEE